MILLGACSGDEPVRDSASPTESAPPADPESWLKASCKAPERHIELIQRGYYPGRSPDVTMTPKEPNLFATEVGTTHSGPWPYLVDVPLVFYGPGLIEPKGEVDTPATIADVAPTVTGQLTLPTM